MTRNQVSRLKRAGQTIIDRSGDVIGDYSPTGTDRGYFAMSTDVKFDGGQTLLCVPGENDVAGTVLASVNRGATPIVLEDGGKSTITVAFYCRPRDVDRWSAVDTWKVYLLFSNADDTADYIQEPIDNGDFMPGWNYFAIPIDADEESSERLDGWYRDTSTTSGGGVTTAIGLTQIRIDLAASAKLTVGGGIDSISAANNTITFSSAHDLIDGDAIFFTHATTVPGGTTANMPVFVRVVDATTVQLYADHLFGTLIDLDGTGDTATPLHSPLMYFGDVVYGRRHRPIVCLVFDDGSKETYTEAFNGGTVAESLQDLGWPGNVAVISGLARIGDGDPTMSEAQLQEVFDAGWGMLNHAQDTDNLGDQDLAEITAEIAECRDYLREKGWSDGDIFIYPGGQYLDSDLNDTPRQAARAAGMKFARALASSAQAKGNLPLWVGLQDDSDLDLSCWSILINASASAENVLLRIDNCMRIGLPIIMLTLHRIIAGATGSDLTPAQFDVLIAGLKQRHAAGLFDIMNVPDAFAAVFEGGARRNEA